MPGGVWIWLLQRRGVSGQRGACFLPFQTRERRLWKDYEKNHNRLSLERGKYESKPACDGRPVETSNRPQPLKNRQQGIKSPPPVSQRGVILFKGQGQARIPPPSAKDAACLTPTSTQRRAMIRTTPFTARV